VSEAASDQEHDLQNWRFSPAASIALRVWRSQWMTCRPCKLQRPIDHCTQFELDIEPHDVGEGTPTPGGIHWRTARQPGSLPVVACHGACCQAGGGGGGRVRRPAEAVSGR
jgi:hypothetical protein